MSKNRKKALFQGAFLTGKIFFNFLKKTVDKEKEKWYINQAVAEGHSDVP